MSLFDFFSFSFHAHSEKKQADVPFFGRSMVEMLGVLAIIGVLSVGAISGYSKAMMKYKMNKQAEQLSTILNNALIYAGEFKSDTFHGLNSSFLKLGIFPKEMIRGSENNPQIYDALGNKIGTAFHVSGTSYWYSLQIQMEDSNYSVESCRNAVTAIKENSADLWQITVTKISGGDYDYSQRIFGDKYCSGRISICIRDLKLTDIDEFCKSCESDDDSCILTVFFGYNV